MSEISLSFPDSIYSESSKPSVNTLKSDLTGIELGHNDLEATVAALDASTASDLATHEADTSTHGVTTVAGVTEVQTLTNKTLTSPKINEDVALTATATELNILDGITASTAELNVLDGIPATLTATELGYVDGVTSAIQTQIDAKAPTASPNFSGFPTFGTSGLGLQDANFDYYLALKTGENITGSNKNLDLRVNNANRVLTVAGDATISGTNTGDQTLPVKATGAEVNTGTDDAKFVTPKAIADSYLTNEYYGMARQAIMNGNFDVWQRGTSVALADVTLAYQADRWGDYQNKDGGTLPTLTRSRQLLTSGDIPGAKYFSRLTTNGAGTSLGVNSNHQYFEKIENGTSKLCGNGKKVTKSYWLRSDIANKRISVSLIQDYGTGGSPSAAEIIKGTPITLTSTWTKYTFTFTTNTLVGKTFGTNGDDFLQVIFFDMWGTTWGNTYVQTGVTAETFRGSGNIDIAQVQLCAGDVALPFQPKSYEEELRACQRYYETGSARLDSYGLAGAVCSTPIWFKTWKRTAPTIAQGNLTNINCSATPTNTNTDNNVFYSYRVATGTGTVAFTETWTASAELQIISIE